MLRHFIDVNNTFFTILHYPISYLEFVGTIFNLACVILAAKRKISNWPIGIIGAILFGILFFKINLYADFFEQIFYFVTGIWGWWMWARTKDINKEKHEVKTTTNSARANLYWLIGIAASSFVLSYVLFRIHDWLPGLFPEPASSPVIDATTTIMSFAAQILMMKRKLESWWLWIAVDVVAIGFYWYKGIPFVALLYVIFLVNAVYAFYDWRKSMKGAVTSQAKEA